MIPALLFLSDTDDSADDSSDEIDNGCWANESSTTNSARNRESIPSDQDNGWFLKYFHVSRGVFKILYEGILPKLTTTERGPTVYEKLSAALRYLAKGTCTSDLGVGGYKAMPRKAFQRMFLDTLAAIHDLVYSKYVSLNRNASEQQQQGKSSFAGQFPLLAGVGLCAIGTHIEIAEPAEDKYLFYYKYGAYCLNALLICDQNKRIRYANASFYAAMNDVHLWSSSGLDSYFSDEYYNGSANCYVLASSTFPCKMWLITPKQDAKPNSPEAAFNEQHEKAFAAAVETMRLLKDRFRCLLGNPPIPYKPAECATIVKVCCALHNMCMECETVQ
ncbi:putative nuclease HARBI1 [Anopheles maculipalpis]|uniref:putative nuclease HARBI1 n=1 Tax=Anopheles maculipalpis TaxID=1496333 RepID=UPI0021597AA7|nr:putative nuclease HARBI1 [Anopheles maculipalpis]